MPAIVCSSCGTSNREGVKFCTSCGRKLGAAAQTSPVLETPAGSAIGQDAALAVGTALFRWFTLENCIYVALLLATVITRVVGAGDRPLHHDESLHATYSYYLFHEGRYQYDPMMHGPFQFHLTAFVYYLFGANDWSARIPPALFGVFLVAIPFWIRKELGRTTALCLSFVLFLSGSFFYYSRFLREDIYTATWTLLMVAAGLKWWLSRQDKYLYALAAAFSFSFCTKESTYISMFIFGNFLMAKYNWDLLSRRPQPQQQYLKIAFVGLLLAAWLVYAKTEGHNAWLYFGLAVAAIHVAFGVLSVSVLLARVRTVGADIGANRRLVPWIVSIFGLAFLMALLRDVPSWRASVILPILAVVLGGLAIVHRRAPGLLAKPIALVVTIVTWALVLSIATGAVRASGGHPLDGLATIAVGVPLFLIVAYYLQSFRRAFWCTAVFLIPFTLLYTTFFSNPKGFFDGYTASLGYWLTQQKVERGSEPYYYYLPLLWLYDFPALVLSVFAAIRYLVHRSMLTTFLIFWAVMSLLMYSLAGERMPWLVLHIALPLTVLSAYYVGDLWDRRPKGQRAWVGTVMAVSAAFYAHGAFVLVYFHGANPVEPLVYVQSADDVNKVVHQIQDLSYQMTGGKDLKICVTSDATWPFPWYLRDYKNVQYPSAIPPNGGDFPVIVTDWYDEKQEKTTRDLVGPDYDYRRYHHRVWWDADVRAVLPGYRNIKTWGDLRDFLREAQWTKIDWKKLWELWMYREPWADTVNPKVVLGAQEMMLFVKKGLIHKYD